MSQYKETFQVNKDVIFRSYINKTILTMGAGLGVSALVALAFSMFYEKIQAVLGPAYFVVMLATLVAEIVIAIIFTKNIMRYTKGTNWVLFMVYSALTGFTLSIVIYGYQLGSVFLALIVTAVLFICMAIIGFTTKVDFTKFSSLALVGLIAIALVSLINVFFLQIAWINMVVTYISIILFLFLIAMDVQRLKQLFDAAENNDEVADKLQVMGAFQLYLDFVNLFLRILQVFGKRKN